MNVKEFFRDIMPFALVGALIIGFAGGGYAGSKYHPFQPADPQVAEGEWNIEIQIPPCGNGDTEATATHNLQVIWPEREGDVLTVECHKMPVRTK